MKKQIIMEIKTAEELLELKKQVQEKIDEAYNNEEVCGKIIEAFEQLIIKNPSITCMDFIVEDFLIKGDSHYEHFVKKGLSYLKSIGYDIIEHSELAERRYFNINGRGKWIARISLDKPKIKKKKLFSWF